MCGLPRTRWVEKRKCSKWYPRKGGTRTEGVCLFGWLVWIAVDNGGGVYIPLYE